jgi:hypothetical protein
VQPGAVIREAWDLYKTHWQHLLPIALVVYVVLGLVSLLLAIALGWFGAILGALISIIGVFWLQATLVEAVVDIRDGRADLSMGQTFARAQEHIGRVAVAGILAGLAIAVGLLLLIVPGLYLMTIWSVLIPVIVLERKAVMEAFGRSRELVSGNGWNVFGVIVISFLILIGAGILLGIALFWLPGAFGEYIRSVISNTITIPFVALAWTIMYFRLLELKEPAAATAAAATPDVPPPAAPPAEAPPPPAAPPAGPPPPPA